MDDKQKTIDLLTLGLLQEKQNSARLLDACKAFVKAVFTDYSGNPIPHEPPDKTYYESFGGGDCSKHGRYYGTCHSCRNDMRQHYEQGRISRRIEKDTAISEAAVKAKAAISAAEKGENYE